MKAKLQEVGYGGDGDMADGAVIAPEVIVTAQVRCLVERVVGLDGSSMQLCVCVISFIYPATCSLNEPGSSGRCLYILPSPVPVRHTPAKLHGILSS